MPLSNSSPRQGPIDWLGCHPFAVCWVPAGFLCWTWTDSCSALAPLPVEVRGLDPSTLDLDCHSAHLLYPACIIKLLEEPPTLIWYRFIRSGSPGLPVSLFYFKSSWRFFCTSRVRINIKVCWTSIGAPSPAPAPDSRKYLSTLPQIPLSPQPASLRLRGSSCQTQGQGLFRIHSRDPPHQHSSG